MRAGLIIGGIFVGFFGFLLTLTILLAIFGIPLMIVGFIMFIVGLFTSGKQIVYIPQSQSPVQQQVVISSQPQPIQSTQGASFCGHCGKQINSDLKFCPYCGKER